MPEILSTVTLGLTSIRVLAGVVGVGYSFFNKDIIGETAKPLEKIQESIFGEFIGGLASDWAGKAKDLTVKQFYSQIAKIDKDNLNHDLQRSARKAQLIATLFACEACLQEIRTEQYLQGNRAIRLVKNIVWRHADTQWLTAVKNWIKHELKILPNIAPQTNVDYEEAFRLFDPSLNISPDEQQKQLIKNTKDAVLAELRHRPYEKSGFSVEYSEDGYKLLEKKINEGWDEFIPSDETIIQLHLSDRNLPDEKKNQDKWFWLLCSFFSEEYKTNERLKAAMLKNLLLDQRKTLSGLSLTIATLDSKLTSIETKQDEILQLLKRIELAAKRESFFAKYQGLEAKIRVEDFIKSKTDFTVLGRDDEYNEIDKFLRENKSGYFVITAKAGFGKSALLAKWIRQRLHQNEINYKQRIFIAYHFFNREFSATRTLEAGFTHLIQQISAYRAEEFPTEINRLRDTIVGIIKYRQPSENEPLVIVLDALDEAEDNIDPFIESLPEGVFVIVSARADENEKPRYLKHWLELIKSDRSNSLFLKELDKKDIQQWLSIGRLTKYHLETEDEIVDLIYQKTLGFPLYLRYLIEEITDNLENKKTKETIKASLEAMPKGFGKFIEKQFDELCQSLPNDWQKEMQSLLSIMSVSLGAFSEYDVKKLTSLNTTELRGLPSKIRRWVRITQDKEENKFFSFDHDLLREVFATQIFRDERDESLERLLAYCSEWKKHDESRYVLRHFAEHLYKRQSWQTLYELAQNEDFLKAQERVFVFESDAGLRTLQVALQASMDTDDAPRMAEFVLKHAYKVITLTNETPFESLRISIEKAISQTELIYNNNVERGVLWFLLLAKHHYRIGQRQEAIRLLTKLQTHNISTFIIDKWERLASFFLSELAKDNEDAVLALQNRLLTDVGSQELISNLLSFEDESFSIQRRLQLTRRIIESVGVEQIRAEALSVIAIAQSQSGQVEEAKQTLNQAKQIAQVITDKWNCAEAWSWIAAAQLQTGKLEEAEQSFDEIFRTVGELTHEQNDSKAWSLIAIAQARAGQIEEAIQAVQDLLLDDFLDETLSWIVKAHAQAGQIEEAKKTAQEIFSEKYHAEALSLIAEAQAQAGQIEDAKQTVQKIMTEEYRDEALGLISLAQERAGQAEAAEQSFVQILSSVGEIINIKEHKAKALTLIAEAQAQAGRFEDAKQTAREIMIENHYAEALSLIVGAEAQAGRFEEAKQTAKVITTEWRLPQLWSLIAKAQAQAGQFEEAKQTAREMTGRGKLADVWSSIAEAQAQAGHFEDAKQTVQKIMTEEYRDEALGLIAKAQAQAGHFGEAIQTTQEIMNEQRHAETLNCIAIAQSQSGQVEEAKQTLNQAKQTAQVITSKISRAEALGWIAADQMKAGQMEEAKQTLDQLIRSVGEIKLEKHRAEAFILIAEAQAQAGQIEDAKQTVQKIMTEEHRDEALSWIAKAQVQAGRIGETKHTAREITDKWIRAQVWGWVAIAQVKAGCSVSMLQTDELNSQLKNEYFSQIAAACAEKGNKELFKAVLPIIAYYLDSTYEIIGIMAKLYPHQSIGIVEVLKTN